MSTSTETRWDEDPKVIRDAAFGWVEQDRKSATIYFAAMAEALAAMPVAA